jgi:putative ABC transport system permease protein
MFDKDNWQEIFAAIRKNKLRTFLTALGVFWGIFMLVIMLGSGTGLRNGITQGFEGTATNSFFIWTQKTSVAYKGMKAGRNFEFNLADAQAIANSLPEVETVAPQNQLGDYQGVNNVVRGLRTGGFAVNANYPVIQKINSIKIAKGRFLNDLDIKEKRKVAVIGQRVQEVLFLKNEDPIGQYIRINGVYFKVIGLTQTSGAGEQAQEMSERIDLPFTTFQSAFNFGDRVGWFAITSKKEIPASVAEEKVIALLKERHYIAPDDDRAIGHWNMEKEYNKITGLFAGINSLVWFVGIGTLMAGVIGVSNIMLIIVKERTKEIGIKRALGATPFEIISQLMLESVFLTTLAGYFGLVSGIALIETLSANLPADENSMFINPQVRIYVAVIALLILIVAGAIAGLIPAKRAVSISTVDALRAE